MAYQTYITEALVCGATPHNTSDKVFRLFTREAGMVYAHARSVREEKSKHRYALQPFSHARVTLVRGKSGWKVTGTEPLQNFYSSTESREERAFWRNTALFLRRVMQGETVYREVFDDVLTAGRHIDGEALQRLEYVLFLRILHTLGYVAPLPPYQALLHGEAPYARLTELPVTVEKKCKEAIEYALLQSQL